MSISYMQNFKGVACLLVLAFTTQMAFADVTVTFDPPPLINGGRLISSYNESAVSVYSVSLGKVSHTDSGCSALMPDNGTGYLGFLVGSDGYRFDMGGQLFTAKQIDLAEYSTVYTRPATVRFTGYKADGTTVSASFVTDGVIDGTGPAADFQTFTFPSTFTDLTRIELLDIGFSMDNLTVSSTPPPPGTNCTLTVVDARGSSAPASGAHSYVSGTDVSANAQSPVTDGMIRYVCSGASVEGNAYTLDGTTNVLMTLTNATTLVWQWTTNYWLTATSTGNGTVSGSGWYVPGAQVNLVATPATGCEFLGWSDGSQDMSRWVTVSAAGNEYTARFTPQPVRVDATVTFDAAPLAHRMHAISSYTENAVSLYTTGTTHKAYTLSGGFAGGPDNGTGYFRFSDKASGWRIDMGGQRFTPRQIDLAEYSVVYRKPAIVRFVGYKADGTTVSTSFTIDGLIRVRGAVADFQTFISPQTFSELIRVEILDARFSMDNLIVSTTLEHTPSYTLTVLDARGSSAPASGAHEYVTGTRISAVAQSPVTDGALRYICSGSSIQGNAYTLEGSTNVVMTLTNATTLAWLWTTNFWLESASSGNGTASGSGWYLPGDQAHLTATPAPGCQFAGWSDGSQATSRWVTVSAAGDQYTAQFIPWQGERDFVVTFDPPPVVDGSRAPTSYTENGVFLSSPSPASVLHTDSGGPAFYPDNGSGYFQFLALASGWKIEMGGHLFTAKRIDLSEYSTVFQRPASICFVGYKTDGTTVTTWFVTDGVIDGTGPVADFQTFTFPSTFMDLTRVEIRSTLFSMDNLVLSQTLTNAPSSSLAISGASLASNPMPFALWSEQQGLAGPSEAVFSAINSEYGLPNGLVYAFQSQLKAGKPLLSIRFIDGHPVAETPAQDPETVAFVTVAVVGSTSLQDPDWSLAPVPQNMGSSVIWVNPVPLSQAFYKLRATLK